MSFAKKRKVVGDSKVTELLGGISGLCDLVPTGDELELQFTRGTELSVYLALLNWNKEDYGHTVAGVRHLVLNLDGPDDKTWLADVSVLNGLYREVPGLFPKLERLTIKWHCRDTNEAKDGRVVGDVRELAIAMRSLCHVEVKTHTSVMERTLFKESMPSNVRVDIGLKSGRHKSEDVSPAAVPAVVVTASSAVASVDVSSTASAMLTTEPPFPLWGGSPLSPLSPLLSPVSPSYSPTSLYSPTSPSYSPYLSPASAPVASAVESLARPVLSNAVPLASAAGAATAPEVATSAAAVPEVATSTTAAVDPMRATEPPFPFWLTDPALPSTPALNVPLSPLYSPSAMSDE